MVPNVDEEYIFRLSIVLHVFTSVKNIILLGFSHQETLLRCSKKDSS